MNERRKEGRKEGSQPHAFNSNTQETETKWISESEASMVYRASSKTAKATQRNCLRKKKINHQPPEKKKIYLRVCLHECMPHMCGGQGSQKAAMYLLELGSQEAVHLGGY